jgi:predicted dienelactone hydrolase
MIRNTRQVIRRLGPLTRSWYGFRIAMKEALQSFTVGCRRLELFDAKQGAKIPLAVLYPSRADEQVVRFGPYPLSVAMDAPAADGTSPLVVVSHGNGSSPWTFRGLAARLASEGFVVAMPEHPGNSRSDNSLAHTTANLANRPRHVKLVIDAVFERFSCSPRVAVIGHSIGAYTALAVAGGQPSCTPHESPDGLSRPIEVVHDPRVAALVLLAPAAIWFTPDGSLDAVDAPIFLRTGEHDEEAPAFHGQIVRRGARGRIDAREVENAGHFSFQSPFPPELSRPDFPPAHDPPGFDRAAYQPILHAEVLDFLRATLGAR